MRYLIIILQLELLMGISFRFSHVIELRVQLNVNFHLTTLCGAFAGVLQKWMSSDGFLKLLCYKICRTPHVSSSVNCRKIPRVL